MFRHALGLAVATLIVCVGVSIGAFTRATAGPEDDWKLKTEPADPQVQVEVRVAKEFNRSISKGLATRIASSLNKLPENVRDFLLAAPRDVQAELAGVASGANYDPPGDDELSFAELRGGIEAIADQISAAYTGSTSPLVIMTVAERGPYVIAAAYLLASTDGKPGLKRVSRLVLNSTDTDKPAVEEKWPECFAEAIAREIKNKQANGNDSCQIGALPQSAPTQPSPQAPPSQRVVSAPKAQPGAKGAGMLDDVPAAPGLTVTIPPTASAPAHPTPSGPAVSLAPSPPPAQPAAKPQVKITPAPAPAPPAVAALPGKPLPAGAKLWEDVYGYGFVWLPHDSSRIETQVLQMVKRDNDAGECLRRLEASWGRPGRLEEMMKEDFMSGLRTSVTRSRVNDVDDLSVNHYYFRVEPKKLNRSDLSDNPRGCMSSTELLPFNYTLAPDPLYTSAQAKDLIYRKRLEHPDVAGIAPLNVRLPTALEAFAIGTALIESDSVKTQFQFWADSGGSHVILRIKKLGGRDVSELDLDFGPTNGRDARLARLLIVF